LNAADLVLHSGRLRTLYPAHPRAEAIAITAGRIVAVGTNAEVRAHLGPKTAVLDLGGAAGVPGLTDCHQHPFWGAVLARGADLTGAKSLDDVCAALRQESTRCSPDEWVLGFGLDYNVFGAVPVSTAIIEDAIGDRPALVTFADLHTGLASGKALAVAGIEGPCVFDERAEVVCVDDVPTGELREIPALNLVRAAMPVIDSARRYRLCADQLRRLAAAGLTAVHVMDGDLGTLDLVRELEERGDLVTRLVVPFWIKSDSSEEQWEEFAAHGAEPGGRWRGGVAKFFLDGVIDTGTGWLFEPDAEGEGTTPLWPEPERYRRAVDYFTRRGFQCVTHAIGDRAVHEALNAYRDAGPPAGPRAVCHRVEHIETIQPDDLRRFAEEGVAASMQPQHLMWLSADRSDNWSRRLGPERCARAFPFRALLDTGAHIAFGSDWPVADFDPRHGLAAAQLRRPAGEQSRPPYDANGVDGLAALRSYTSTAAAVVGEQFLSGHLRPGYRADVTVMSEDPVDCPADELPKNEVLLTIVDGEIVHADKSLS
jgi:predicted amidohydrolase YtcJ